MLWKTASNLSFIFQKYGQWPMKKLFVLCSYYDRFTLFKDNYLNYKKTYIFMARASKTSNSKCLRTLADAWILWKNISGLNPNARNSFSTYTLWTVFLFVIGVFL